jgi:hypothetical protein
MIYIPPPYRPRLFPRAVRWTLLVIGCVVFVIYCVAMMWLLSAFQ